MEWIRAFSFWLTYILRKFRQFILELSYYYNKFFYWWIFQIKFSCLKYPYIDLFMLFIYIYYFRHLQNFVYLGKTEKIKEIYCFILNYQSEIWDNEQFITLVPKVFLIRWLVNFGDLSEFWFVGFLSWVFKRFNHYL